MSFCSVQQAGLAAAHSLAAPPSPHPLPSSPPHKLATPSPGELIEWAGFAVGTWSWPALSWLLFCTSTFVPRALTHLRWYRDTFPEYPRSRKALIPFVL
mgnify:CR=1 FL=1